jgi:hypothetical protein
MKSPTSLLLLLLFGFGLNAQLNPNLLTDFNLERENLNQQGLSILASWSVLNMAWSVFNLRSGDPTNQAYHQMNFAWNTVNLAIAGFGSYQSLHALGDLSLLSSLSEQAKIKRILAVNAALDLTYMLGGVYLREYAKSSDKANRFEGFGRAVIVNGAFLFVFDVILYFVHDRHEIRDLLPFLQQINLGPNQIGLRIHF